jgi:integrase
MAKDRSGFITERNGKIYVRVAWTDSNGKRREMMRRATDQVEAEQLLEKLQSQLDAADRDQKIEAEQMTFAQLAKRYGDIKHIPAEYQGDRKIAGLRALASAKHWLKRLVEHFGKRRIHSITHSEVEGYKLKMLREGKAISTANRELEVLRAVFNFAKRESWLDKSPFERGTPLISKADETKRDRVLSRDEESRLLATCIGRRAHLYPLIIAAIDTGMRKGELLTLRWTDVGLPSRLIRLRAFNTKTAKARTVPISDRLAIELEKLWQRCDDADSLVFGIVDNVKNGFRSACKAAGIEGLRFHDLRHTYATRLASAGLPLNELAGLLGHTQIETTLRYANTTNESISRAANLLNRMNEASVSLDGQDGGEGQGGFIN